ncbi:MAG: YbaN family protein [Dehalococcoidia bacterium]|nr:MAG: YbaN family protein [Dehalococcoidia bacterium]
MSHTLRKQLLIVAGTASLIAGIVGVFIPILPTTPFLLLAAACYIRSSERLYRSLLNNRLVGGYIRDYIHGKGMPIKIKIITLLVLWITIGISAFLVAHIAVRIILLLVAIGVSIHIVLIKTKK